MVAAKSTMLLVNRSSRQGRELPIRTLKDALAEAGHECEIRAANDFPALKKLAEEALSRRIGQIIVAGGDGTVSGIAALALDADVPLGVIPCGTANDFAASLRIPAEPAGALSAVIGGHTRRIDVGVVNGLMFLNAAGFGLGTTVTQSLDDEDKRRWGPVAYARCLRNAASRRKMLKVDISCDDRRYTETVLQVTVTNGLHYGGGLSAPADAALDDGVLHVLRVMPQSLVELVELLPAMLAGRFQQLDRVQVDRGETVSIGTRHPLDVSVDGELLTRTPCKFSVRKKALTVFVPAYTHAPENVERRETEDPHGDERLASPHDAIPDTGSVSPG